MFCLKDYVGFYAVYSPYLAEIARICRQVGGEDLILQHPIVIEIEVAIFVLCTGIDSLCRFIIIYRV